MNYMLADLYKY